MTKYEEIYFISKLLSKASKNGVVELNAELDWQDLSLTNNTLVNDEYLYTLNEKGVLKYEEIGEDGFRPIIICSITNKTKEFLKELIIHSENNLLELKAEIERLNLRILEILTFDPEKLSDEIKSTENIIVKTKEQLNSSPLLRPLQPQLEQIEIHFKSLSKVAHNYEEVYKNIILPVKEEGKSGIRQTVRWAIISIIMSTILSVIISWLMK